MDTHPLIEWAKKNGKSTSQDYLAKITGLSQMTISNMLNLKTHPSFNTINAIIRTTNGEVTYAHISNYHLDNEAQIEK